MLNIMSRFTRLDPFADSTAFRNPQVVIILKIEPKLRWQTKILFPSDLPRGHAPEGQHNLAQRFSAGLPGKGTTSVVPIKTIKMRL